MNAKSLNSPLALLGTWLLLAAFAADAGEPEKTDPPKIILRERTVYVPYDKLAETFEKEGRGVFLPYAEFLKLWNAAQPKPPTPEDPKPPAGAVVSGGAYTGTVTDTVARFEVVYKVRSLEKGWSEVLLPLEDVAVESVQLSDPNAVFAPKGDGYALLIPKAGEVTVTLTFAVRVDVQPGRRSIEFGIPPSAVSRLDLTIPEKELRVDVKPAMAATITTPQENSTKVLALVGNADKVSISWMPPADKVEKGESLVTASQLIHAELGERAFRLDTLIGFKIERNEEDLFRIQLPKEMRLLSVKGNNIREWKIENGILNVHLHSPVKDGYSLLLRHERILDKTPSSLDIPFPVVVGALREDGYVTIANEAGLRMRVETTGGLSQIDPKELPEALSKGTYLAAFRYWAQPLSLSLAVETVLPQVQSAVTAVVSLGAEEDTLSGWVDYTISKVGVFVLKLRFDARWDVSTVGDKQTIEDSQVAVDGDKKTLTINLKNRALGTFRLPFKLSASGRATAGELTVEPVQVVDTQQDKGLFGISAPKSFKLTTIERARATPANVQQLFASGVLAQLPSDADIPLAFTYTQSPASVKVGLERRQTEIRAWAYHLATIGEAGFEATHTLKYLIEFAGVDKLQLSMPKELEETANIVSPGMKEKRKIAEREGRVFFEIALQEKVLGPVTVTITHRRDFKDAGHETELTFPDVRPEEAKGVEGFVAIRKESTLEIEPKPVNLEPIEAIHLPAEMKASSVYLAFRYFQPDRSLALKLTRHDSLKLARTAVHLLRSTMVVSEEMKVSVRTVLFVETRGEQYLEIELPSGAAVRTLSVNGAPTNPLLRADGVTLIALGASQPASMPIEIIHTLAQKEGEVFGATGRIELSTLKVRSAPVGKVELDLYLPEDYAYTSFAGTLHLRPDGAPSNVLEWILTAFREGNDPHIDSGDMNRFISPQSQLGTFTTQGRRFRFQTLASVGEVSVRYWGPKTFFTLSALALVVMFVIGWLLRKSLPLLAVLLIVIMLPLSLSWFTSGDAARPMNAGLLGGIVVALILTLSAGRRRFSAWRQARIANAPDPFLEEGPSKAETPAEPAETPADASSATPSATSGESSDEKSEAKSDEKSDGKKEDPK